MTVVPYFHILLLIVFVCAVMLTHAITSSTESCVFSLLSTVCHNGSADLLSLALGKAALKCKRKPLVEFSLGAKAIYNILVTLHKEA